MRSQPSKPWAKPLPTVDANGVPLDILQPGHALVDMTKHAA